MSSSIFTEAEADDFLAFNISTDPRVNRSLGDGDDLVSVSAADDVAQVRLIVTGAEVGDGSDNESGTLPNQNGGLAVRLRAEDANGGVSANGQTSRFDDEGISFIANGNLTFDIREVTSGIAVGDQFSIARFGTQAADLYDEGDSTLNTYINGGRGDDDITGGQGNDFLIGGAGDDVLVGGAGNDTFIGSAGEDRISGGEGSDTNFYAIGGGADAVNLGTELDVNFILTSGPGQIRLTFTSSEVGNDNAADSGTLTGQDGLLAVRLQAEDDSDDLTGDVARFDDEGVVFFSPTGARFDVRDLVSGVQRGDQFGLVALGAAAADTFDYATFADNAYLNGGSGDDTLIGGDGEDFLVGGAGDDSLTGSAGDDNLLGGDGADSAFVDVSTDGADVVDLGGGNDSVFVSDSSGSGRVRLTFTSSEVGNSNVNDAGTLTNQDGGLAVRLQSQSDPDTLVGDVSRYDDEAINFVADEGVTFDVRDLPSGVGRGGEFQVVGLGGSGGDGFLVADETRNYYVNGGGGDDTVVTGSGNDFLVGGAGNDRLSGGAGDDSFIGGAGRDAISGGDGADTVTYNVSTDGSDRVNLGTGTDIALLSAAAGTTQIRLTFTSSEVGNGDAAESGTLTNQDGSLAVRVQTEGENEALSTTVGRFDDEGTIFVSNTPGVTFDVRDLPSGVSRGEQFDIVVLGTADDDTYDFSAFARNYYVNGGGGNDTIVGGQAFDFLVGGAGDDILDSSGGSDVLLGGGGADTFTFTDNPGDDTILDFVSGTDKLDLSAFEITGDDVSSATVDGNTLLFVDTTGDGTGDFTITLTGVTTAPVATDYIL